MSVCVLSSLKSLLYQNIIVQSLFFVFYSLFIHNKMISDVSGQRVLSTPNNSNNWNATYDEFGGNNSNVSTIQTEPSHIVLVYIFLPVIIIFLIGGLVLFAKYSKQRSRWENCTFIHLWKELTSLVITMLKKRTSTFIVWPKLEN